MIRLQNLSSQRVLDAIDDFRQAANRDDLWARLHRHLAEFGITGMIYGTEAMPDPDRDLFLVINSIAPAWHEEKMSQDLFLCDGYVRYARAKTDPILWSDRSHVVAMPQESRNSLELDYDFGVIAGVSIPMHFANGLGVSSIGCHAAHLSMNEFDRIWAQRGHTIMSLVNAFDLRLRENHIGELYPLTAGERECLLRLATGLTQQQIADRLRVSDRCIEKRLTSARHKLNAETTTQAVASALIFGLIDP
ncbi:helix-turn-helix transcriptional regulator [Magnetospirillum fulvum]|uniref:Regulatory protein, luxR family n=1 Tax=Magnetospirillum fulvum TaxID=1082 RepID=A0A1H6HJL8_MAGFU|nr:LuxR family transcriptional regulator [Magnetospirillum fulvum]SEH35951.1 regulatory protein, luxR family [Magnetospirillum fulvum]